MTSKYPGLTARMRREMISPSGDTWSCTGLTGCWTVPSGVSGRAVTAPAASTPGIPGRARSTSAWVRATSPGSENPPPRALVRNTRRFSASNPVSTSRTAVAERTSSTEPTRTVRASAVSATTRTWLSRHAPRPPGAVAPPRTMSVALTAPMRTAGTVPTSRAARSETAEQYPNTSGESVVTRSSRGMEAGRIASRPRTPSHATHRPRSPPATASTMLSERTERAICIGAAPRARLIAP